MTDVNILRADHLKVNDVEPSLRAKLFQDGDPYNLDGFDVQFKMMLAGENTPTVDATATVDDPTRGLVDYDWKSGDTSTRGTYMVEFVATNVDGSQITFPNEGYAQLYIEEGL